MRSLNFWGQDTIFFFFKSRTGSIFRVRKIVSKCYYSTIQSSTKFHRDDIYYDFLVPINDYPKSTPNNARFTIPGLGMDGSAPFSLDQSNLLKLGQPAAKVYKYGPRAPTQGIRVHIPLQELSNRKVKI